jgi:cysteine desulfurase
VAHVAALGMTAEMAIKIHEKRRKHYRKIKDAALAAFSLLAPRIHGRPEETMDHVLNLPFPGIDSEVLIVALRYAVVAILNHMPHRARSGWIADGCRLSGRSIDFKLLLR